MSLTETSTETLLLHNPKCSKSRATAELLTERGVTFTERRYLERPLTYVELQELGGLLGKPIAEWIRPKEAAYREAGLSAASLESEILEAVSKNAILMERPIVIRGDRAAIGRPPENVLSILD